MGIRMSGLSSGMDTEAIVKELMSAQSMKKNKVVKAKTKLEWTQTKWSELNTKLTGLYNNFVSKMQLSTAYKTKKTTVSDATKASVAAKTSAANGNYSMEIKNVATSQYLTGAKINAAASDKLTDIDSSLLNKEISITVGAKTTKFAVTADTTLKDFTSALQSAGLNASFDDAQKRLFISSKESGLENAFSITTSGITLSLIHIFVTGTHTEKIKVLDEEKALIGDDKNRTMGTELFSRRGVERYTKENVTVVNDDGTTSVVPVYRYQDVYKRQTLCNLNCCHIQKELHSFLLFSEKKQP